VVVAAASGPVGSLVGQLANWPERRPWESPEAPRSAPMSATSWALTPSSTAALGDFRRRWREPASDGIDVYFESVGGPVWQAVAALLQPLRAGAGLRVIAFYNGVSRSNRDMLPAAMMTIVKRSLLVQGYINTEFVADHYATSYGKSVHSSHLGAFAIAKILSGASKRRRRRSSECCPAEISESCWFVLGKARRVQGFFVLAIRSYSVPIRSAVCLGCPDRVSTLLVVDVLKSGIYDLWAAVEAP